MTVTAAAPSPSSNGVSSTKVTALPRKPPPFPTPQALALERMSLRELEVVFQRGSMPDLEGLVGWEFRGINVVPLQQIPVTELAGIKKFVKGFYRSEDGRVLGYNSPVVCNVLDGRWHMKPSDSAPKRFGFYEAHPVDATARDNHALHALLLDYGKGKNPPFDIMAALRDYLVQVDPTNPDLLLGKAMFAVGPLRIPLPNFFILERHRRGLTDYAAR
ncbi:MAG: hypothetical protein H0T42_05565 [Deltaproteobacteria bacterium]|nr:hypothetical protein [Deltaproteobacteria bacterium]